MYETITVGIIKDSRGKGTMWFGFGFGFGFDVSIVLGAVGAVLGTCPAFDLIAECTKCDSLMRRSCCTTSATAKVSLVTDSKDDEKHTLSQCLLISSIRSLIAIPPQTSEGLFLLLLLLNLMLTPIANVVYSVQTL